MSAQGIGAGTIAVGVLIGVLAIAFPPASAGFWFYAAALGASASLIAGGTMSLTSSPKNLSAGDNRAADFAMANAGEGFPVPVLFGEQKITGNFLNYSKDFFRSVAVPGESGIGGKGGGPAATSTIGYEYFLSFEYGLCIGPVDSIAQVYSTPGEKVMMGDTPTLAVFSSDYQEIQLDEVDPLNPQGRQGGP